MKKSLQLIFALSISAIIFIGLSSQSGKQPKPDKQNQSSEQLYTLKVTADFLNKLNNVIDRSTADHLTVKEVQDGLAKQWYPQYLSYIKEMAKQDSILKKNIKDSLERIKH